jgi:heme oxygenase
MDLREATKDKHRSAENTALSRSMVDGTMKASTYAAFMENMLAIYEELERDGTITKPEVLRADRIRADISSMGVPPQGLGLATVYYTRYLRELPAHHRWAHIYVHYLGNMYGGQLIGRRLPGPHTHLDFDDLKGCISYVRGNLDVVTAEEANSAFDWTIRIYDELHTLFG